MSDGLKPGRKRLLEMTEEGSLVDTIADMAYWLEDLEVRVRAIEQRAPRPSELGDAAGAEQAPEYVGNAGLHATQWDLADSIRRYPLGAMVIGASLSWLIGRQAGIRQDRRTRRRR